MKFNIYFTIKNKGLNEGLFKKTSFNFNCYIITDLHDSH